MLDVVAPGVPCALVELPRPAAAPQELLVQRPEPPRPDERPVVEADRRERPPDLVGDGHEVEVERPRTFCAWTTRPRGSARCIRARSAHRRRSSGSSGSARAAEEPARAVVLERAREHALACRERRRAERVALEPGDLPARECERDRPGAVDPLAGWGSSLMRVGSREPPGPGRLRLGKRDLETSFVRVSRSARNHSPHPSGAATTRAARPRRCRGSTRSRSARGGRWRARPDASSPRRSTRTRRPAEGRSTGTRAGTTSSSPSDPELHSRATLCQNPQRTYTDVAHSSTLHPSNRRRRTGDRGPRHARGRRVSSGRTRSPGERA